MVSIQDLLAFVNRYTKTRQVYERGVASIGISVDLWANYCGFKVDTCHDGDIIRE